MCHKYTVFSVILVEKSENWSASKSQIPLRYLVADRFEAKNNYAIWSKTGPRLVTDLLARSSSLTS